MREIVEFKDKADLKRQIIAAYLKEITAVCRMHERLLYDKDWASNGSSYHNRCRSEIEATVKELCRQIEILKTRK